MKPPPLFSLGPILLVLPCSATVSIDYVTVGNAGNLADITGYGAVGHDYRIAKYEVTNAQYAEFLNAKAANDPYGLYDGNMASFGISQNGSPGSYTYNVTTGSENLPVGFISWFDAARFTNWLSNGQGSGDTETGSYTVNGATEGVIYVNIGATVYLPSEDEWYKAAYYDPTKNGGSGGYWLYPTQSDTISTAEANYGMSLGSPSVVGSYPTSTYYGTFDQAGNVREWNDAVVFDSLRGLRGSSWNSGDSDSSDRLYDSPSNGWTNLGFRVASSIPEPNGPVLTLLACGTMLVRRRRLKAGTPQPGGPRSDFGFH